MNLTNRGIALIAILMLFMILLPTAVGLVNLAGGDDSPDDYYLQGGENTAVWAKMQDHQILSGLMMRMAVFALIVVYLGGRSNDRRFNDRIIDSANLLGLFFMTALLRAVFVSLRSARLDRTNEGLNKDTNSFNDLYYKEVLSHAFDC